MGFSREIGLIAEIEERSWQDARTGTTAQQFDVHPNQITQWRRQLLGGAAGVFGDTVKAETVPAVDVKSLHAKIGELTLEKDFLSAALGKAGLLARAKR